MGKKIKALVIGAGPAGITAAWELQKRGTKLKLLKPKINPAVFEKSKLIE
jgi:protoporphyrinogen oxidase